MFTIIEDNSWFGATSNKIRLHWRSNPDQFQASANSRFSSARVNFGDPGGFFRNDGAFYSRPGEFCLYDGYGNRVIESCVRRDADLSELINAGPEVIEAPTNFRVVEEPLVYLSGVTGHWGHFLTEGVSRMWALIDRPETTNLRCFAELPYPTEPSVCDYLAALGLPRERLVHFDAPVKIERCIIPAASFSNRGEAYSSHLHPSRMVAAAYENAQNLERSSQPVYLSRSKLKPGSVRLIRGEVDLEQTLAELGVRIVYPEMLTLSQQISLISRHKIFIGCIGSAFHGLSLAREAEHITTHVLCERLPNANYLMFDVLLNCRSNYIQALYPTAGKPQVWPNLDLTIDVDSTVTYLRESGCV